MTKNWERYRVVIINLYKQQNLPLHEVRRILKDQYGFSASIRAYRTRFDKWRVSKYNCQRRRDSHCTQWSSDSNHPLTFSPREAPAVVAMMLTGTPGPLPVPVSIPFARPGDDATGGNYSLSSRSPRSPDLSPTASSSSYPGTPPSPGGDDNPLSYQDHGKLSPFPSSLNPLDSALSPQQQQQPLPPGLLPRVLPQTPRAYAPASATEDGTGQPVTYSYYGPRMTPAGYFDIAVHDSRGYSISL